MLQSIPRFSRTKVLSGKSGAELPVAVDHQTQSPNLTSHVAAAIRMALYSPIKSRNARGIYIKHAIVGIHQFRVYHIMILC